MNWDRDAVSDEELEALTRQVLDDAVVEDVIGMAMTGWDLQDPDAALATITFDSSVSGSAAAGVRQTDTSRHAKVFESEGCSIDLEQTDLAWIGQVAPVPRSITLETLTGSEDLELDEYGRFRTEPIGSQPIRLKVTTVDGLTVITEWFLPPHTD